MSVRNIGSNQTEVSLSNGDTILVSYSTPVAANVGSAFYRIEKNGALQLPDILTNG